MLFYGKENEVKIREIESKNKNKKKNKNQNYIQQVENEFTWKESFGRADLPNLHYALED